MKQKKSKKRVQKSRSVAAPEAFSKRRLFVICALLLIPTAAVYWQIRGHGFIHYDDNVYITENRHIQAGLSVEGIKWAFTSGYAANWHPLTWLSHMADVELFGLNPAGHHLMNLLMHLASSLMLFLVMRKMTANQWASWFIAAVFALHPLHVESVAWAAERKDVLSAMMWMAVMWSYVRYVEDRKAGWYGAMLAFYALGLMSKPMLVTLPFVLLLMDYWPLRRIDLGQATVGNKTKTGQRAGSILTAGDLIKEKLPLMAMAAASSVITLMAQRNWGTVQPADVLPLGSRLENTVVSFVRYILKAIWPVNLVILYPHPHNAIPVWQTAGAAVVLIALTAVVVIERKRRPYLIVGWLWYIGTLVPVIGIVQVGSQSIADRYMYIPLVGITIMLAFFVVELVRRLQIGSRLVTAVLATVLLALMIVTFKQLSYWKSSIPLFEHALALTEQNWLARNNLGVALADQGRLDEAIVQYRQAIQVSPTYADAYNNLGVSLDDQGRFDEALAQYREAVRIKPDYAEAHYNMGITLSNQGKLDEAVAEYEQAVRVKPEYAEAHNNIGIILVQQRKYGEAILHYKEALRIDPGFVRARNNWERVIELQKQQ
jgi:Flp pilus assembly protein TadD